MNPSTQLLMDEICKLFAEQNAWLDRRFAESITPTPTPAPSATATSIMTAPAPSAIASVVPAPSPPAEDESFHAAALPPPFPSVIADNWGGLFDPAAHILKERDFDLHDGAIAGPVSASLGFLRLRSVGLQGASSSTSAFSSPSTATHTRYPPAAIPTAPMSRSDIQIHHHRASTTAACPASSLLPLFKYHGTKVPITEQFPDTTSAIASIVVDLDVLSLDGRNDAIETEASIDSLQSSRKEMLREWRAELSVHSPASFLLQLVMPVEEDTVPSSLTNRCLMNCLTIMPRCFSLPFNGSWEAVLCWQHRPWPPPSELRLVSYEAELRPLPWPSFNMVERYSVTSLSDRLWKPPWYVSTQQHISRVLPEPIELQKCLMILGRIVVIPVLLGKCLPDYEVMTASILLKPKLVHHGSCSDSGVSSVHILVHHSIAYQPWHSDQMVLCSISGVTNTSLEMSEHLARVVHSGGLAQYLVDKNIQSYFSPSWVAVLWEYMMISALVVVVMSDLLGMRPIPWPSFCYSAVEFGSSNTTNSLLVASELLEPRISWAGFLHSSAIARPEPHVLHSFSYCCIPCGLVHPIRLFHLLSPWTPNFFLLLLSGSAADASLLTLCLARWMAQQLLLLENKVVDVTHVDMKVWFDYNLSPVLVLRKHLIIAMLLSLKPFWFTTSTCCIELQLWPPPWQPSFINCHATASEREYRSCGGRTTTPAVHGHQFLIILQRAWALLISNSLLNAQLGWCTWQASLVQKRHGDWVAACRRVFQLSLLLVDTYRHRCGNCDDIDAQTGYLLAPHHAELIERQWDGSTHITVEEVKKRIPNLLQEYIRNGDTVEACRCIRKLAVPLFHHEVVKRTLTLRMDTSAECLSSSLMMTRFCCVDESLAALILAIPSAKSAKSEPTVTHAAVPPALHKHTGRQLSKKESKKHMIVQFPWDPGGSDLLHRLGGKPKLKKGGMSGITHGWAVIWVMGFGLGIAEHWPRAQAVTYKSTGAPAGKEIEQQTEYPRLLTTWQPNLKQSNASWCGLH